MPLKNDFYTQLDQMARERGVPLRGVFELTGRCNLDCKMCYVHVMDHRQAAKKELSTAQWLELMDAAYDNGMMFALLTGGEPLVRPDFKELYLHLYNKGVRMSVNTNGTLLNEELFQFFHTYKPERIQMSIYGSTEAGYEHVTGHRKLEKTMDSIKRLKQDGHNLDVAITPSSLIRDEVVSAIEMLRSVGVVCRVNAGLLKARDGIERDDWSLTFEEDIAIRKERLKLKGIDCTEREAVPPTGGPCADCPQEGLLCRAGMCRFFLSWEGVMMPCMAMPELHVDALKEGFMPAWKKINVQTRKALQPVECKDCFYSKYCPLCPSRRFDGLYSGHCNKEQCKLVQEQYRLGVLR